MIIRKPYAFLIKHFRKIHIIMLLLGCYIFYKTIDSVRFVNDFMNYGVYDLYSNPVSNHITSLMQFSIIVMMIGSIALLLLLKHKEKPWKAYLFTAIIYSILFLTLGMIKSFFRGYTEIVNTADLRLSRDLLIIFMFIELPALAIFLSRVFGIDMKKFHFNLDLEKLDLKEEDREEIEIGLNIDGYTIIRWLRKFKRNIGYFYKEHKIISRLLIIIVFAFLIHKSYIVFFVNNKSYKQGQLYNVNGYSITVNNSYFTDKDNRGNVISENSNFVIVELEVKNNNEARTIDTANFHLKAGTKDYTTTETTYAHEFEDLGTCYSKVRKIKKDESFQFIIVYKVDKKIRKGRFVLFYQEQGGIFKLRKIKLNVKDLRKMQKAVTKQMGEEIEVTIKNKEDIISFDDYEIKDYIEYKVNNCNTQGCDIKTTLYEAKKGYKILSLEFASGSYEAKNVIDFLRKYGKIKYKDNEDKDRSIDISIAVDKNYFGKTVYIEIPEEVTLSESIFLDIIIRNREFIYQII